MAWQQTLVIITRNLVNDLAPSGSQTFTDSRIQEAITIGGLLSAQEYDYNNTYTFDLSTPNITPDPTDPNINEQIAWALFTLKAACILNQNSYMGAVAGGARVADGDDSIDTSVGFKGYKDILDLGPCGAYTKLVRFRNLRDSLLRGKCISTPFSHEKFLVTDFYAGPFFDQFLIR